MQLVFRTVVVDLALPRPQLLVEPKSRSALVESPVGGSSPQTKGAPRHPQSL